MTATAADPWPTELKLAKDKAWLTVTYDDGRSFDFPAEFLRVMSPSAEVKGHGPNDRVTVAGKKNVRIARLDPVGNYAIRIVFDDGHDTGLYAWTYLREIGERKDERFQAYLEELSKKGLSR
jgi:DUF971 family protein